MFSRLDILRIIFLKLVKLETFDSKDDEISKASLFSTLKQTRTRRNKVCCDKNVLHEVVFKKCGIVSVFISDKTFRRNTDRHFTNCDRQRKAINRMGYLVLLHHISNYSADSDVVLEIVCLVFTNSRRKTQVSRLKNNACKQL